MITQEYLKECVQYNPDTGVFTWKKRPREHFRTSHGMNIFNSQKAGKPVTYRDSGGYVCVKLGKLTRVHRLAFLYMTGSIPFSVDHRNCVKDDNRWCNLRPATKSQNTMNKGPAKHNTSGYKGVSWHKQTGKWQVRIQAGGKYKSFGLYDDLEDAVGVARNAREMHHGEFARHE